jgi:hypothetical protein
MTNTISFVQSKVLKENMQTIHSFLKQSYDEAKQQLENGVGFLQDRASFLKDELSAFYQGSGQCLNRMLLPVNNFVKDLQQIDLDLKKEMSIESPHTLLMDGEMVPVEKVLTMPMEENY